MALLQGQSPTMASWTDLLQYLSQTIVVVFDEPWEVVACALVKMRRTQQHAILYATNSSTLATVAFGPDVAGGIEVSTKTAKWRPENRTREHDGKALTRQQGAQQSAERLIRAGKTGELDDKAKKVLEVLSVGALSFVESTNTHEDRWAYNYHAEMALVNHIVLTDGIDPPFTGEPIYVATSKPCCALCFLFFIAMNQREPGWFSCCDVSHGEVYEQWRIPVICDNNRKLQKTFYGMVKQNVPGMYVMNGCYVYCDHEKGNTFVVSKLKTEELNPPRSPFSRSDY